MMLLNSLPERTAKPLQEKKQYASLSEITKEPQLCFECRGINPTWISVNLGIYLCLKCSGLHRSLSVNQSFVRSLLMDKLSNKQIEMIRCGGNHRFYKFLKTYDLLELPPQTRYKT
jgi:ADP-ribosylation factor GTPase-activating protein 1